jgi:hypothetical protein
VPKNLHLPNFIALQLFQNDLKHLMMYEFFILNSGFKKIQIFYPPEQKRHKAKNVNTFFS